MALNCEVLGKPFPPELIKQRAGNFGTLDYTLNGHGMRLLVVCLNSAGQAS